MYSTAPVMQESWVRILLNSAFLMVIFATQYLSCGIAGMSSHAFKSCFSIKRVEGVKTKSCETLEHLLDDSNKFLFCLHLRVFFINSLSSMLPRLIPVFYTSLLYWETCSEALHYSRDYYSTLIWPVTNQAPRKTIGYCFENNRIYCFPNSRWRRLFSVNQEVN